MRAWHLSLLVLVAMCLCEGLTDNSGGRLQQVLEQLRNLDEPSYDHDHFEALLRDVLHILKEIKAQGTIVPEVGLTDNSGGRLQQVLKQLRNLDEPSYDHDHFEALLRDVLHIPKEIKAQGTIVPEVGKVIEKINLGRPGRPTDTLLVEVPQEIKDCLAISVPYQNPINNGGITYPFYPKSINNGRLRTCLQDVLWRCPEDDDRVDSDIEVMSQFPVIPGDKNRIRREYRTLSKAERDAYHAAVQTLIEDGTLTSFARIHNGSLKYAHSGPAFLPWHRAFITKYEEALRKVNPEVTLPYWDSSLDNEMEHPVDSILWTDEYFGNGMGEVIIGPFAGAMSPTGLVERNYAEAGRLIDRCKVAQMMSQCHLRNISDPPAISHISLEGFHGDLHDWVGGDMGAIPTAGFDPIFFMHHCYIDYLWEKFREHQVNDCGVDPVADYTDMDKTDNQGPDDPMYGLSEYTIADGATNFWTQNVYKYEEAPSCENKCGNSPVLCCEKDRCVSIVKPVSELPVYTTPDESGHYETTSLDDCTWPWVKPNLTLYPPLSKGRVKRPLSLTLHQDLILQARMVPRNRGPAFLPNLPSDGRTVRMRLLDAITSIRKFPIG